MAWNVWFLPSQPNHVVKFEPLMEELRRRGCTIHALCVDVAIPQRMRLRQMLEVRGWQFETLPMPGFFVCKRWPVELLQKPRLRGAIRRWMTSHDADLLIFGTDSPYVIREFIREAEVQHVPRVHIHDGICGGRNPRRKVGFLLGLRMALSTPLRRAVGMYPPRGEHSADLFFVMDETSVLTMEKHGVPRDRIQVVGSPQLDPLVNRSKQPPRPEELRALSERLRLPPDRPILLFAHQHIVYSRQVARDLVRHMLAGVRRSGGTLLVKFHPSSGEVVEEWNAWARQQGYGAEEVVFVLEGLLSVEAAQLCHACVTAYSTVALEAMICGKPVLLIQYLQVPHFIAWGERYGAALDVFDHQQLEEGAVAVMADEQVRARLLRNADVCLQKEFGGLDGRSTERMADALMHLMRSYKERS